LRGAAAYFGEAGAAGYEGVFEVGLSAMFVRLGVGKAGEVIILGGGKRQGSGYPALINSSASTSLVKLLIYMTSGSSEIISVVYRCASHLSGIRSSGYTGAVSRFEGEK
jgi:hypothetical protein